MITKLFNQSSLKLITRISLCSSIVVLSLAGISLAQTTYINQVKEQLLGAAIAAGLLNYDLTHDPYIDNLFHRESEAVTLTLRKGYSYSIIGVCDEDCGDIDLFLYDENGNRIDSHDGSDSYPVVEVTPRWTANFTVKTHMYQCSASPCYYGLGIFAGY